jgi:hypothetical protein
MMPNSIAAALCLVAFGLTACEEPRKTGGNAKICADFKAVRPAPAVGSADGAAPLDECVRRWAYSLAPSRDDADAVAEAAVGACSSQLARWNQQTLNQPGSAGEATSITTGQPTTPLAEHNAFAHARALFYVVQARAGNCPAPPAVAGAPEGVVG